MLSNDKQREKTMKEFLLAMNIDLAGIDLSCRNGLYSFSFKEKTQAQQFTKQLKMLLQSEDVRTPFSTINLDTIIDNESAGATCSDSKKFKIYRASCEGLLELIKEAKTEFSFSAESGEIAITLPAPGYVKIFELLEYPHLKFREDGQEGELVLNPEQYIDEMEEGVVFFEGFNPNQLPLVFLKSSFLESKRIFYATKALESGAVEVTPYFFVPQTTVAPDYHFALDVSGSMDEVKGIGKDSSLTKLKDSVKKLAAQLFAFQPDAELSIITFSSGVHPLGVFTKENLPALNKAIDELKTIGDTPLYDVTAELIGKIITSTNHNNILLFTDGKDSGSKDVSKRKIHDLLNSLDSDLIKASNKFNLFNYNTKSNLLMEKVAATFASDVVNVDSPDFMKALKEDPEVLQRWAAARGLFSARVVVDHAVEGRSETTYVKAFNMSGQMEALETRECLPGEILNISITDSSGETVVESTNKIKAPQKPLCVSALLSTLGINASPATSVESTEKEPVNEKSLSF